MDNNLIVLQASEIAKQSIKRESIRSAKRVMKSKVNHQDYMDELAEFLEINPKIGCIKIDEMGNTIYKR